MNAVPNRRRLTPELRREQILDEAAALVLSEGVSAVSMERLGRAAGVSKALVYAYFDGRNELLSALLLREYRHFQLIARSLLARTEGFEAAVRATTGAWLDHVAERGTLIDRLTNEPEIARAIEPIDSEGRSLTITYFAKQIAREYRIDQAQAATLAELLMGLTGAAGAHLHRTGADRVAMLDLVVRLIFAALADVAGQSTQPD